MEGFCWVLWVVEKVVDNFWLGGLAWRLRRGFWVKYLFDNFLLIFESVSKKTTLRFRGFSVLVLWLKIPPIL